MYITILVKQSYWYISQVSGERLQDNWSSGLAHLSQRLTCELIVYPCSGDRLCVVVHNGKDLL